MEEFFIQSIDGQGRPNLAAKPRHEPEIPLLSNREESTVPVSAFKPENPGNCFAERRPFRTVIGSQPHHYVQDLLKKKPG